MILDLRTRIQEATLDRYEIEGELGRGGMATVFLARDLRYDRHVALKVMDPGTAPATTSERFEREITIAATLNHPNALAVIDSGFRNGLQYYVMPYVEGESLRDRLDREGQLPIEEALHITRQAAGALHAAHRRNLIHRDVKPANILLTGDHAYLADFGIAREAESAERLTSTGISIGTPTYMSPEQATGSQRIDGRSDQYSLACVLYEMLAGRPPFMGATHQEIIARHALDPMPSVRSARPTVPPALEKTLERALAKNPADRFRSLEEFVSNLPTAADLATADLRVTARALRARPLRRTLLAAALGLAAIAAAVTIFRPSGPSGGAVDENRVLMAVLPLANAGAPRDAYFADGLSEEITSRLTRVAGLGIIARNNRLEYGDEDRDIAGIGRDLGVRYVLAGTVRWSDGPGETRQVRVSPELVEVETGTTVWSEPVAAPEEDVFALQSRLAEQVVAALQIRLGEDERAALRRQSTENVQAYEHYARGRFQWKKRTAEGMRLAIDEFEAAIAEDSTFARAWAGLADVYVLYNQYGGTDLARPEALEKGREAAEAALRLDRNLAEAYASLGEIAMYADWDWDTAERHFERAIELDPDYATAHQWYSELLAVNGRQNEALEEGRTAARLDPTSAAATHAAAYPLLASYQFDEAEAEYERVLQLDPNYVYARLGLLWTHIAKGDLGAAFGDLDRMGDTTALARAWVSAAIDPNARADARRVVERNEHVVESMPQLYRAAIYASVGDADDAISVLREAEADRNQDVFGIKSLPIFDPLRGDPRFREMIARLGFPPDRLPPGSQGG